ncbi:hypothetical protein GDO81_002813 [Engystomops pustulosus]|uniref:Uncharacterized protein n=1 Tax=Engystomops pustulosus TaxID=76066 RepID=A0AAV7DP23_ENGPU|nr:hypothetical protein GDO81_002813 [Engystomops pustulosus]
MSSSLFSVNVPHPVTSFNFNLGRIFSGMANLKDQHKKITKDLSTWMTAPPLYRGVRGSAPSTCAPSI